jgi:hypothetical protein
MTYDNQYNIVDISKDSTVTYDNQYNIVDISKDSTGPKKYFCNNCHRSLFLTDKDTQEYLCTFCNIIYYPNNQLVKKANGFEVPDGSDPNVDKSLVIKKAFFYDKVK